MDRGNLRAIGGVLSAFLIIGAIHQFRPHTTSAPDFPCDSARSTSVTISIAEGESGSSIAASLYNAKVVRSQDAFFRIAVADSRAQSIAPGVHQVSQHLCAQQALEQLLDSKRISNLLSIIEGEWNREIKAELVRIGFSQLEVNKAFSTAQLPAGYKSLEGLLFPAQYSFDVKASIPEIISKIISRANSEIADAGIASSIDGYSPQQLLTIASLIQAEGDVKDYTKISQVIRNRLKIGMPLQFDSTVHYIKGTRGSMFLSTVSTYLNSPYNTYRHYGLPPAPINNPGALAMKAAGTPEKGPWLYFITVAPGDTRFTDSLNQFNDWKVLYKKNLKAGVFRSKK